MNTLPPRPQSPDADYPQPPALSAAGLSEMDAIYKEYVQGVRDKYMDTTREIKAVWENYGDDLLKSFSLRFSLVAGAAVILGIYSIVITVLYLCA